MAGRRQDILLVDDDELCRGVIRRLIISLYPQVEVKEASNGSQALDLIDDWTACIVSDITMPVLDGFHMCWSLRNSAPYRPWRELPVILMAARHRDQEMMELAWKAGTSLLLPKPFSEYELAKAMWEGARIEPALPNWRQPVADEPAVKALPTPRALLNRR